MIDIKYLREHVEEVKANVKLRRSSADVDSCVRLDDERLTLLREVEDLRRERNEVADAMKNAGEADRPALIVKGKDLKEKVGVIEQRLEEVTKQWQDAMLRIPNLTHVEAPSGDDDHDNRELRQVGEVKKLDFTPKSHLELSKQHDLIDFERGARVSGAKFYFLKGKMAILELALIRYAIDMVSREGFTPIITPDLAKEEVLVGKGFLPRGPEKQVYYVEGEDLALVGTAEITMLGYHMNETLKDEEMPKKYVALSHCFRTEAGSYGREEYGLYRVHQFSKIEMFAFAKPEQSEAIHLEFLRLEEMLWQKLGIPYRVVDCSTGDLGGSDYRRYDLEAWMWGKNGGQGGWGEITSTSNCIDYQARGLNIKYETKDGQREFVHTLNGTAIATPRALLAILENGQQADGSILIPEVLVPYCGFDKIG